MRRDFILFLALLAGCASYQVPQKELARLEVLTQDHYQKKIDPKKVFSKGHQFPTYQDHFFYFLYHLEQEPGNYYIDGQELEDYFEESSLESLIPLSKIKLITKEEDILTFYSQAFEEVIPGTLGQVSLKASRNIEFRVQNNSGILELFLRKGRLRTDTTPLAQQLANFKDFDVQYLSVTPCDIFFGQWSGTISTNSQSNIYIFRGVKYDLLENQAKKSSCTSVIISDIRVEK